VAVVPLILVGVAVVPVVLTITHAGAGAAPVDLVATATPAPRVADPAELLISDVPGFLPFDPVPGHEDGLSLAEAADLDEETARERRVQLDELDYQRGAIRWWASQDNRIMYIVVFEFADAEGAAGYAEDFRLRVAVDGSVDSLQVPVPGAVGYGYAVGKSYGYEVLFTKAHRVYHLVHVNPTRKPTGEETIVDTLTEQYRRG
jgi:hypothetical protein